PGCRASAGHRRCGHDHAGGHSRCRPGGGDGALASDGESRGAESRRRTGACLDWVERGGPAAERDARLVARRGGARSRRAARGERWRFGATATPGPVATASLAGLNGISVARRYRLEGGDSTAVIATVNGDPWLVREGDVVLLGSRLDTVWTALPASPAFVPFV